MSNSTLLQDCIRRTKRRWKTTIVLNNSVRTAIDPITGEQTLNDTKITIRKAVILPQSMARRFRYDLSHLAGSGVAFTHGGMFDQGERYILIDERDLKGTIPKPGMLVTVDGEDTVNEVKLAKKMHQGEGWILQILGVDGVTNVN